MSKSTRMTFKKDFDREIDGQTSVHFVKGETYDVPGAIVDAVTAEGAAEPASPDAAPPESPVVP